MIFDAYSAVASAIATLPLFRLPLPDAAFYTPLRRAVVTFAMREAYFFMPRLLR